MGGKEGGEGMIFQETAASSKQQRPKMVFMSLKSKLGLPGVRPPGALHAAFDPSQYSRMLSGWHSMRQYHVYGFVRMGTVTALMAVEERESGHGRLLALSVDPALTGRGLGRRLVVETFCSLKLESLSAAVPEDTLGFYQRNQFEVVSTQDSGQGILLYHCLLTRSALYAAYAHEYSSGAVLYCEREGQRLYAVVTELSGNTGLPKGMWSRGIAMRRRPCGKFMRKPESGRRSCPALRASWCIPRGGGC